MFIFLLEILFITINHTKISRQFNLPISKFLNDFIETPLRYVNKIFKKSSIFFYSNYFDRAYATFNGYTGQRYAINNFSIIEMSH